MTGTTVFPSCAWACVSVVAGADPRSPGGVPASAEAGGAVAGEGTGEAGDGTVLGAPLETTIGGKRYIRHQLIPPPGRRSEPTTVRRVVVCGWEGGRDGAGGDAVALASSSSPSSPMSGAPASAS